MRHVIASTLAFGLTLFPVLAHGETFTVDPAASPVEFRATGKPGFLKINGRKAQLGGVARRDVGLISGEFQVDLTILETGIELRDTHMKDKYLETGKFPAATLRLVSQKIGLDGKSASFEGLLTIKGQERPISGSARLTESAGRIAGDATFKIKLSDYPVGVPSYLGVTVAEDVEVLVTIAATAKPGA